jgi:hypothetical protein
VSVPNSIVKVTPRYSDGVTTGDFKFIDVLVLAKTANLPLKQIMSGATFVCEFEGSKRALYFDVNAPSQCFSKKQRKSVGFPDRGSMVKITRGWIDRFIHTLIENDKSSLALGRIEAQEILGAMMSELLRDLELADEDEGGEVDETDGVEAQGSEASEAKGGEEDTRSIKKKGGEEGSRVKKGGDQGSGSRGVEKKEGRRGGKRENSDDKSYGGDQGRTGSGEGTGNMKLRGR